MQRCHVFGVGGLERGLSGSHLYTIATGRQPCAYPAVQRDFTKLRLLWPAGDKIDQERYNLGSIPVPITGTSFGSAGAHVIVECMDLTGPRAHTATDETVQTMQKLP